MYLILIYYIKKEFCIAKNNVVLNQSENVIQSDTLFYWDVKDSLKAIEWGYGTVNPGMWGYKNPEKKKRRKG